MSKTKSRPAPVLQAFAPFTANGQRTVLMLAGAVLVLGGVLIARAAAPAAMSECDFLLLLKREALRCGDKVIAYEGAETRLQCAARRAHRVAETRGLEPPQRADTLIALFVALDAQVHAGTLSPAAAARRLETFVGLKDCLKTGDETPG